MTSAADTTSEPPRDEVAQVLAERRRLKREILGYRLRSLARWTTLGGVLALAWLGYTHGMQAWSDARWADYQECVEDLGPSDRYGCWQRTISYYGVTATWTWGEREYRECLRNHRHAGRAGCWEHYKR